jgi:hypothetical protein
MSTTPNTSDQVYQLRIQLRGISPPIWRRVVVSSDATIQDLHTVIQATMGWENIHLHRFLIRGHWYDVPDQYAVAFLAGPSELTLSEFRFYEYERFVYEYDFYSEWIHDIRVEKMLPAERFPDVPICLGGRGACPLEDTGPADRFMALQDERSLFDILEWLEEELEEDQSGEELRDRIRDWLPWLEQFDRKATNFRLKQPDSIDQGIFELD